MELDSSKYDIFVTRTRLVARYMFSHNTSGYGVGAGDELLGHTLRRLPSLALAQKSDAPLGWCKAVTHSFWSTRYSSSLRHPIFQMAPILWCQTRLTP